MENLWKHQAFALKKYKDRQFFGLLFPCGTGKSRAAIALAEEKEMPVLIIAPAALCGQWKEALEDKKNTNKDWEVVMCTSRTKTTKKFRKSFEKLCYGGEDVF